MSLSDLASLGSFVSGLAVLASLVYLTVQVRQTERYQRASVQQERAARLSDVYLRIATMTEVLDKGARGDDDLSPAQFAQFQYLSNAVHFNSEDTFRQHKLGLISDDVFEGFCTQMRGAAASMPGWRAMWKQQIRLTKGKDFREFVDQIVAETPLAAPGDALANWKAAVATERGNVGKA